MDSKPTLLHEPSHQLPVWLHSTLSHSCGLCLSLIYPRRNIKLLSNVTDVFYPGNLELDNY